MSKTPIQDNWNKAKAWYKSKTIIGILIAAIGAALNFFFPEVDLTGAVDTVIESGDELAQGIDSIYAQVLQVFGLILALWGRIKAKVPIK